jgi:TonB-linked SusC/RagA family outer membrane protein
VPDYYFETIQLVYILSMEKVQRFKCYLKGGMNSALCLGLVLVSLLTIPISSALAKFGEIQGTVKDASGEALIGAMVSVKGKPGGVATDVDGNFRINAEPTEVLVFSYVGYVTQEIAVGNRTSIEVVLSEDAKSLDEVVVIGYGVAKKRDLTGSTVSLKAADIADRPNPNPLNTLQGKVSGVQVTNSGTPGATPDIRIRGTVSTGVTRPLYLIDGIFNDNMDYVNPNDIESIEVLKDASTLAIFGVRGANGVIAVTTKKGKEGKMSVNFNTTYGFKQLSKKIGMVNAAQFKELYEEERRNIGDNSVFDYSPWTADTDFIDEVTRVGAYNANNLSIMHGSEKNTVKFGIGYMMDEGIVQKQKLKRLTLNFNDEVKLIKWLKMGVNLSGMQQSNPWGGANGALEQARRAIPIGPAYGPDGVTPAMLSPLQSSGIYNPLIDIENNANTFRNNTLRGVGSFFTEINFLKNFNFRATWYGDMEGTEGRTFFPRRVAYFPITGQVAGYEQGLTRVEQTNSKSTKFQQDYILNYIKSFNEKHNFTGTAGVTSYLLKASSVGGSAAQGSSGSSLEIPNDPRFWYLNSGFADPNSLRVLPNSTWQIERATLSYLVRGMYNYNHKYFLSASYRKDGSSAFLGSNRWQDFYAIGAAWDVTSEDFFKVKGIDYLKVKASYGQLGNQNTYGFDYPAYPELSTGNSGVFGGTLYPAYSQSYLPDPNLKWESILTTEAGFELAAFNNRLSLDAAYYNRTSKDLLTIIPGVQGAQDGLTNIGSIRSSGIEASASWAQNLNHGVRLTVGANITTINNKVLELASKDMSIINGINRVQEGYPIGFFHGYVVDGIFQSEADINSYHEVIGLGTVRPGDVKFRDINGDGVIDVNDRTMIGNPTPDFIYGANVNLAFKGLDLGIDFQGVYGNEIYRRWNSTESEFQRVNYADFQLERWNGPGTSNWIPILGADHRINYQYSTLAVEDGSYFRIRNIQLGYSFPKTITDKLKLQNFRAFANIQNLKTWANNHGYTPEFGAGTPNPGDRNASIYMGNDNGGGAIPVVTTFGINVTF